VTPAVLHLDANVVLRFLRNDDPAQSPAAARLFESSKSGRATLHLSAVSLAEIFYVLVKVYGMRRPEAAAKLLPLVRSDAIEVEHRHRASNTLQRIIAANVDFGDAYLAATAREAGATVASFDRDFAAFKDVTTVVPR
jgi:predicted nucleic acid-binding protein